jgi:hypothetical protein
MCEIPEGESKVRIVFKKSDVIKIAQDHIRENTDLDVVATDVSVMNTDEAILTIVFEFRNNQ